LKGKAKNYQRQQERQMTDFKYPSWQKPYQEALIEFDPEQLQKKIEATENAIFLRFQELSGMNGQGQGERAALNDALRTLRALQTERLHYPKIPDEYIQS
jgi:hypothetical protein